MTKRGFHKKPQREWPGDFEHFAYPPPPKRQGASDTDYGPVRGRRGITAINPTINRSPSGSGSTNTAPPSAGGEK